MTTSELRKALAWAKCALSLREWTFEIDTCDTPPPWALPDGGQMGSVDPQHEWKKAKVWVSPARCAAAGESVTGSLFHELLHVAAEEHGDKTDSPKFEFLLNRLAAVMEQAYTR